MMSPLVDCALIGDLPAAAAARWGDRPALEFQDRHWSYRQFDAEVDRLVAALGASGIRQGERVATWMNNCPEAEFLFFAIIKAGAVAVPLNTRYRTDDLAYALRQSGSAMLITAARSGPVDNDALLASALGVVSVDDAGRLHAEGAPQLRCVVSMGESRIPGATGWRQFEARTAQAAPAAPQVDPAEAALMVYTSGTTGHPKGVLLNHSGMRLCRDRAVIMELRADDVQLTYLPLFHTYALSYCMIMSFMVGARQVLMETFDGDRALALVEQKQVTVVHGFDAHFNDFLLAGARTPRDTRSLRFGTLTVGPESSVALAREVQDKLCPTLSGYGMTEMWGAVTLTPQGSSLVQRCEASGAAQPGVELRVVDPASQRVLADGEMGEIQVRSYSRMIGYHDNPRASAEAFDAEGWFRTGDAGVLREDGHVRCLARYKDMLKVGGENVSPAEVEAVLAAIPGVQAVAVVSQVHERLQEVPVAFVVAGPEGPRDEQTVIDFCKGKIASFKIPRHVHFVDALPLTPTGKVQKELLRQRLRQNAA